MSIASRRAAQLAYDAQEDPSFYEPTRDDDPLDEFKAGFAKATGYPVGQVYDIWLAWAGWRRRQSWIDEQEEGGYESGLEQGQAYVKEMGMQPQPEGAR